MTRLSPLTWAVKRTRRNEQSFVDDPPRARRLLIRELVTFVLVLIALFTRRSPAESWLDGAAAVFVGVYVGAHAISGVNRALAYRNGWLDGRMLMLSTLSEARARGMTADQWAHIEMARDLFVLGAEPIRDEEGESA